MSETSFEEYRRMVERQTRALMDVIQSVALGDLDVLVESPPEGEGVEVLSELAVGVEMMVDDLREMLAERERAVAKMEAALARTEALYEGSERVVRATTIDDVLQALVYSTVLRRLARNSILLFDHPWGDRRPHIMTVVAAWERDASLGVLSPTDEEPRATVGTRYVLEQFPATRLFDRQEPGIVRDIATDERLDENTRALFLEGLGLRSLVIFPLVAGEQWIGVFAAQDSAVLEMDEAEVRQITTLVGQAAACASWVPLWAAPPLFAWVARRSWRKALPYSRTMAARVWRYEKEASSMRELALNIRENLDALTAEYGQLLRDIPAYAGMPEQSRLSAARSAIQLVAAGLEAGDRDLFVQFTRATAVERVAQGFEIEDVQRALDALAEVVEPLLSTVEAANFLWRVVVQSHTALSQMAMERVKRSQKALQTFMDSTPFGVVVIGRDKKVRRANKAALALMEGESEEQVVGRMCHDTLCPAEVGKCPILDLGQDIDRSERVLVTGEGKHIPVLKSVVSVTLDGEEALLETFVDISERKRMEEELRESEERFRSLVESAHTGILVVDDAYRFTYVNDELCQILGRTRDEVIGLDFRAVLDEESRRLVADRYARRQRGEDVPPRYEFNVVRKDGEKRRVEISTVVVRDSAGNPRTMAHLTDVTGRERLEREVRESLERRGHQVRTGTEVSQEIAAATGLDELFRRVVVLIKERFGYYHAQIFRYEPAVDAVVLVVGYGETGEQMLAAGHRLEMGRGVVGTAAATGRPVLAADVARDEAWVPRCAERDCWRSDRGGPTSAGGPLRPDRHRHRGYSPASGDGGEPA